MLTKSLQNLADKIISFLDAFSKSRFWLVKSAIILGCICMAYSVFVYRGNAKKVILEDKKAHDSVPALVQNLTRTYLDSQLAHPMMIIPEMKGTHAEKLQFRFVVPLIGYILHLNFKQMLMVYHVLGVLMFALIILLVERMTHDRVLGILVALGFAFTYICKVGFVDIGSAFDGFAYFFLALAMYTRKWPLIFLFVLLASYTDERGLISSGFVLIYWKLVSLDGQKLTFKNLFSFDMRSMSVLFAWVAYFAIRLFLAKQYGFQTHTGRIMGDEGMWNSTTHKVIEQMIYALKSFWVLIFLGMYALLIRKNYLAIILILGVCGAVFFAALSVKDVLRSLSYIFPLVFIALYAIYKSAEPIRNIRYITQIIVVLTIITANDLFKIRW